MNTREHHIVQHIIHWHHMTLSGIISYHIMSYQYIRWYHVVYGIWSMVYGMWYMVYGIWYMVYNGTEIKHFNLSLRLHLGAAAQLRPPHLPRSSRHRLQSN